MHSRLLAAVSVAALALVAVPAAFADANHSVTGRGQTATFICPTSFAPTVATINVSAQKSKGTLFGNFSIFGPAVQKFGNLTDGTINENSYSLTGVVTFAFCGFASEAFPAAATISGDCGTGVTIHYTDTYGETGDFIGNVVCS